MDRRREATTPLTSGAPPTRSPMSKIDLSDDCGQGPCDLVVGLYAWDTMERLQRVDAQGQPTQETTVTLDLSHGPQPSGASD